MTATEMAAIVGRKGMLAGNGPQFGLHFPIEVVDVKTAYGRIDYVVRPVGGYGSLVVNSDRVTLSQQ